MSTLHITSDQMTTFVAARLQDFRVVMVKQLRENWGEDFTRLSDEQLLAFIDKGINKAKGYGVTENAEFGMFISIMAEFGVDFDTNGEFPWVPKTLTDTSIPDPNQRVRNLVAQCTFFLGNLEDADEGDDA